MKRIEHEKRTVEQMIKIYCRRKEGNRELCTECEALLEYACYRLDHCQFGEKKTSCRKCKVHCYRPDMASRIKEVMRYSGPRMILRHPFAVIRHMFS